MVNKAILVGNLGKDPEIRYTSSGKAVCNFTLATTEKTKDNEYTEWHRITVWGNQAEACANYLSKGSKVYVEGRIETRSYEKDGVTRYTTEINAYTVQFLDSKKDSVKGNDFKLDPVDDDDGDVPF